MSATHNLIGVKFVPEENAYQAKVYDRHIGYFETEVLAAFKHDEAVYGLLGSQNVRNLSESEREEILNFSTKKYQDLAMIKIFEPEKFSALVLSDINQ